MLTLVLLCAAITSHGAHAFWGTTDWGFTASPSCRNNCGNYFGYCNCRSSCEYYGSCCSDYYDYCGSTAWPTTTLPTTATTYEDTRVTHDLSCRYNCGRDLGSCSCERSCEWRGGCCIDYYSQCMSQTTYDQTTPERRPSCRYNCGRDLGSCSCASSCGYWGKRCCDDFYRHCPSYTPDFATTEWPETPDATTRPSCWGNCGRDLGSCSCHYLCEYNGDCCHDASWYCHIATRPPPDQTTPDSTNDPSCWGNCGRDLGSCSCDFHCEYNGDCCHDASWYCHIATRPPPDPTTPDSTNGPSCWGNCGRDLGSCSCNYLCEYDGSCCHDASWYCHIATPPPPDQTTPDSTNGPSCWGNCGRDLGSCSCNYLCEYDGSCCHDAVRYCHIATPPPPDQTTPDSTNGYSCWGNCGRDLGSCSCHYNCHYQGDCCHDADRYCHIRPPPTPDQTTPYPDWTNGGSCGGSLSGSGSFSSPNYPGYYHDHANCKWQIQTSSDQTLYLRFTNVELENCCYCDYILVYDGPSVNSRLLGKVCHENFNNGSITDFHSSSNYLTVVFRSDFSVVSRGFNAEFSSSLSPELGRVECSSEFMVITVAKSYLTSVGIDPNNVYLNDQSCRPGYSSTHLFFNFRINKCGTVLKFDGGRAVYTNALRSFASNYGEITRQSVNRLNVSCRMGEDSISEIMYEVKHSDRVNISGPGSFLTSMAFYTSDNFRDKVWQSPYLVTLNQYLFVEVKILGREDNRLGLFLDTCVASPSPHDFHNRSYDLVRNGCKADSTFYTYTYTGTSPTARFRFQAFQFLRASEKVYLQCKVLICSTSDYYSRCRRGCVRRKVRDLSSEHQEETVVLGPIQLQKEDDAAEKVEPETKG